MVTELFLPSPEFKRRISVHEILSGPYIEPVKRLELLSADDYEAIVHEWATEFLAHKYKKVRIFAGAGDKGRDVVGYYDDGTVDIYQCKHYDARIAPTTLYPELGKLCYYTSIGAYPVPKKYFIVAPKGCGPDVLDMIANPTKINDIVISNWEKYCLKKITQKADIKLEGSLLQYVKSFNFSILEDIDPAEFVKQHRQTRFHVTSFGIGIKKFREIIPEPELEIHEREQKYTSSLFRVYEHESGITIANYEDLKTQQTLLKHFIQQRKSFYSAESLDKFSRDNFPDASPPPFDELKEDVENILSTTLALHSTDTPYKKVLFASQEIKRHEFTNNPLSLEMRPLDKDGLCHHLVNDERIKWIEE